MIKFHHRSFKMVVAKCRYSQLLFLLSARITEYIQAMKRAIQDQNETDLELALDDLKNLGLASVKEEILYGETELNVMRCRRGNVN